MAIGYVRESVEDAMSMLRELGMQFQKQRVELADLRGRVARLEHVATVDAIATQQMKASPSQQPMWAQRDVIE